MRRHQKTVRKLTTLVLALSMVMCSVGPMTTTLVYADDDPAASPLSDTDAINSLLDEAFQIRPGYYSEETYNALMKARDHAYSLIFKSGVTQEQLDAAAAALQEALDNLEAGTYRKARNIALEKSTSSSGHESGTSYTAEKAVDGISNDVVPGTTTQSRWAGESSRTGNPASNWLEVDLGTVYAVTDIVIDFETIVPEFDILIKEQEDDDYTAVLSATDRPNGSSMKETVSPDQPVRARYINFQAKSGFLHTNGVTYSASIWELEVYADVNVALFKETDASGIEANTSGIVYSQFSSDKAVDGDRTSNESRWSGRCQRNGITPEEVAQEWWVVDLYDIYNIMQIDVWYKNILTDYNIEVSVDGEEYTPVVEVRDGVQAADKELSYRLDKPVEARYVKYQAKSYYTGAVAFGPGFYEFEVYEGIPAPDDRDQFDNAAEALASLGAPRVRDDRLILPALTDDNYEVSLYGCDNEQIVDMDTLQVSIPLIDMPVKIMYEVRHVTDADDTARSETDVSFVVPGNYIQSETDNVKPAIMPGLREWKGNTGSFTLTGSSALVIADASLEETAELIAYFFEEMLGRSLHITTGSPRAGDIWLTMDQSRSELGAEGYYMEIDDVITVNAPAEKGLLYAGITITQAMYQTPGLNSIAKGLIRDYPKWEVRAGMIDVGRTYIPIDGLEELGKYMAWFKLNEIQVHINDHWKNSGYTGYRLQSDKYPQITSEDGSYTFDEYREFQREMFRYGLDVVTELEAPYHAERFRLVEGVPLLSPNSTYYGYLDIREQAAYDFIEDLIDELIDGPNGNDPVVLGDKFHIGTEEYAPSAISNYRELMRKWTDHFINYVNAKGKETRLWNALGGGGASSGYTGTTPVSTDATVNLWAPYWGGVQYTFDLGYDIINTDGYFLYTVPGANAGYGDRVAIDNPIVYNWDPSSFESYRSATTAQARGSVPVSHPQLKGAEFAVWNDMTSFVGGVSETDIFDRIRNAVMLISEKTWYGEVTPEWSYEEWKTRINSLSTRAPGGNIMRYVESDGELIADYNLNYITTDGAVHDRSRNNYNAVAVNGSNAGTGGKGISFDGTGYLSLPMESVGFPYSFSASLWLEELPADGETMSLFSGDDGELYVLNDNGTVKIGYTRGEGGLLYHFTFEDAHTIPVRQWFNLAFSATTNTSASTMPAFNTQGNGGYTNNGQCGDVILYINGERIGNAYQSETKLSGMKYLSTSFILPVEKIMDGTKGAISSLKLYNYQMNDEEIKAAATTEPDPDEVERKYLKLVIDEADALVEAGYHPHLIRRVKELFEDALKAAKEVYDNPAATQEEVNEAKEELVRMMHYLSFTADKDGLQTAITYAEALINSGTYEEDEAMDTYQKLVTEAKEMLSDDYITDTEISAIIEKLVEAEKNLTEKSDTSFNLRFLREEIYRARQLDLRLYLDAGKEAFKEALAKAESVEKAPQSQDEIDTAASALLTARMKLRLIPNKDALKALLEEAKNTDPSRYTAKSYARLASAMTTAQAVYDNPQAEAEEVAQAEKQLKEALNGLKLKSEGGGDPEDPGKPKDPGSSGKPGGSGSVSPTSPSQTGGGAKTGDTTPITLLIILLIISAGAAVIFIYRKRKQ